MYISMSKRNDDDDDEMMVEFAKMLHSEQYRYYTSMLSWLTACKMPHTRRRRNDLMMTLGLSSTSSVSTASDPYGTSIPISAGQN